MRRAGTSSPKRASRQQLGAAEPCPPLCQMQLSPSSLGPQSHLGSPCARQPLAPWPGRATTLPEAARDEGGTSQGSGLTFIFQLVLSVGSVDLVDVELCGTGTQRVRSVLVPRDGSCGQAWTDPRWHCLSALRRGQEFAVPPPPPHMLRPCRDTTTCPVSLTIFSRRLPLASCAPLPALPLRCTLLPS